ncbi:hypothetical protein BWQ96_02110 [Gracilariopsis chorda]|uniref:Uncharacterized protein n=1 Tax=Gracilariopsis chorda TaxID=448386 RepID=A0A2V3J1A6_9FLOR|nr:hypothetical protein BWQ96_02110 [Gracilariopsis chorda]|eukprot:PXF48158.1 hypothetical protein BWQ96_02110 [Gracilariopsis chorda]
MYHQRLADRNSQSAHAFEDTDADGVPIVRHEQSQSDTAYLPEIDATLQPQRSFLNQQPAHHAPQSQTTRRRSSQHITRPLSPTTSTPPRHTTPRSTVDYNSPHSLRDEYDEHTYGLDFVTNHDVLLDDIADESDSQEDTTVLDIRRHQPMLQDHHPQPPSRAKQKSEFSETKVGKIQQSPYIMPTTTTQSTAGERKLYHAYTDALQREARGSAGGLRVIVDLLRESDGNPIVIEKAALAIGILSENDSATRDVFGQHSAVQSLIQCLSIKPTLTKFYDRARLVSAVVYAVACLLKDSPRNVRLFEMFDGPQKMGKVAASSRYENCPSIASNALQALSELKHHPAHSSDSFIAAASTSTSSRTIKFVLKSMGLHEHRMDVQEYGLDALRTLLARSRKESFRMDLLHLCVQATATAFKMHNESKEVQWQCLTLLCDLDDMKDDLFSLELEVESFFGALHLVIGEAKVNGSRDAILKRILVELVCRAMDVAERNGWKNHDFIDSAVDAGAMETVMEALEVFGEHVQLADKICAVLRQLMQSAEGQYRMHSTNSAYSILSGIEAVNMNASQLLPS